MHQSSLYSKQQRKTDVLTWRNQKRIQRQSIDGDEKSARLFHAVLPTLSEKKYRAANGQYATFIDMKKRLLSVFCRVFEADGHSRSPNGKYRPVAAIRWRSLFVWYARKSRRRSYLRRFPTQLWTKRLARRELLLGRQSLEQKQSVSVFHNGKRSRLPPFLTKTQSGTRWRFRSAMAPTPRGQPTVASVPPRIRPVRQTAQAAFPVPWQ